MLLIKVNSPCLTTQLYLSALRKTTCLWLYQRALQLVCSLMITQPFRILRLIEQTTPLRTSSCPKKREWCSTGRIQSRSRLPVQSRDCGSPHALISSMWIGPMTLQAIGGGRSCLMNQRGGRGSNCRPLRIWLSNLNARQLIVWGRRMVSQLRDLTHA